MLNKSAERGVCIVGNTEIEMFRRELQKQWQQENVNKRGWIRCSVAKCRSDLSRVVRIGRI